MASAVDSRLAYARLSAVATASRLPTANRGSNNSYTTSWDTTPLSYARVSLGPISGPFDPRLASAVEQATLSLIPPYNPDYKEQNDPVLLPG